MGQKLSCSRDNQQDHSMSLPSENKRWTKTPCHLFHSLISRQLFSHPEVSTAETDRVIQKSLGFVLALDGKAFPQTQCVFCNDVQKSIIFMFYFTF